MSRLLYSFFKELPREIAEAAFIGGFSVFRMFSKVALPLTAPVEFETDASRASCGTGCTRFGT